MASIAKLVVSLGANTASFETDMKRASRNQSARMKQMKRDAEAMAKGLAIAFTAVTGAMTAVVTKTVSTADSMAKLGKRLGASTEALSELGYVAEKSGVDFRTLEMGLQRMTRRIGEVAFLGKGEAKQALEILGLSAKKLADLPLDKQFEAIAEKLSQVENVSQRTSLAMKVFDAEGVKLVQMMEGGATAIQQMRGELEQTGAVISGQLAADSEKFSNNLALIGKYAEGASVQFTSGLIPSLLGLSDSFLDAAGGSDKFKKAGEFVGDVLRKLVAGMIVLRGVVRAVGMAFLAVADAIYNVFRGLYLSVKRPIDNLARALYHLLRNEVALAAKALEDIPDEVSDAWKDAGAEIIRSMGGISEAMQLLEEDVAAAYEVMNSDVLQEVVVTAEKLPPVLGDVASAASEAGEELEFIGKDAAQGIQRTLPVAIDNVTDSINVMNTMLDESVRILTRTFNDIWSGLIDGSMDAFDSVKQGFRSMMASIAQQAITQPIVVQLQQAFGEGGGGFSSLDWGSLGKNLAGFAGTILGSQLGGGGTGATVGSIAGAIAGQAAVTALSGTWLALGSIGGPVGIAIAAVLGGLLGGVFDKEASPAVEVSMTGLTGTKGQSTSIQTAFGETFLRVRKLGIDGLNEIADALAEFDNTIASFLDDSQIGAVTEALAGWGEKLKGDSISVDALIESRFDAILSTFDTGIQSFVDRGFDLAEQIDRLQVAVSAQKIIDQPIFKDRTVDEFLNVVEAFRVGGQDISEAFNEVLALLEQVASVQAAMHDYADSSLSDDYADLVVMAGQSLEDAVAAMQSALMDAVAGFDGSPEQLQNIGLMVSAIREGELKLLAQIDSIQQGINANLDDLEAKIRGLTEGPKTAEEIFREANALFGQIDGASSTELAALERQFSGLINAIDEADQIALQDSILNMIQGFRDAINAELSAGRVDVIDNGESSRDIVDVFLNDIGDPLDVLANSNVTVAEELGNIDDSIQELGPTIQNAITRGFGGASVNVTLVIDGNRIVNE